MALQRRKILAQALNLGFGTDTIPADTGGLLVGDKIGLHTFLPGVVVLESFGAVGDGQTDDTQAFADAIAAGDLVMGAGGKTYKITSQLDLSLEGQIIDLNGSAVKPVGIFDCFNVMADGVQIFDMDADASGISGSVITNGTAVQQLLFENVQIRNAGVFDAIKLKDVSTSWFRNVDITGHAGTAFHLYSTISGTPINGVYIEDCNFSEGLSPTAASVLIEGASGVFIEGCTFRNNNSGGTDLWLRSTGTASVDGIAITRSYFKAPINQLGNAIYIGDPTSGSVPQDDIFIENNVLETSKQNIRLGLYTTGDVAVIGNTFLFVNGSPTDVIALGSGVPYPRVAQSFGTFNVIQQNYGTISISNTTGTSAATWSAGNGLPTATPANGSMYSRMDGAAGSSFYVYAGGVWTVIA